jgi:hypothetical protein
MSSPQDLLDRLKAMKDKKDDYSVKKSKATVTGAMIGMGGGVILSLNKGYNMFTSIVVGGLLGGLITNLFIPSADSDEDEDE